MRKAAAGLKQQHGKNDTSNTQMENTLPSEADRIQMLRTIMGVAHAFIAASDMIGNATESKLEPVPDNGTVTDSTSNWSDSDTEKKEETSSDESDDKTEDKVTSSSPGSQGGKKKQTIAQERHRLRTKKVLNGELFELVSYSLMLQNKDRSILEVEKPEQPEDAFACVALLLCNIILLSGESGYDARVRHVIKTASVHVLYKSLEKVFPPPVEIHHEEMKKSTETAEKESENNAKTSYEDGNKLDAMEEEPLCAVSAPKEDIQNTTTNTECIETPSELSKRMDETYEKHCNTDSDNIDHITRHQSHLRFLATRRFEAIEKLIATKMLNVVIASSTEKKQEDAKPDEKDNSSWSLSRKGFMRGLKIGTAGVVAGTLFAVTGGLAAPGIAAGLAALGIAGGSAAAAITILTSTTTLMTLFGVGGGGLAAYKMKTRTEDLTEFRIRRENDSEDSDNPASVAEVRTTVCVSGWLLDKCDFQRPWGITPNDPPIINKLELLERFYTVYDPEKVPNAKDILEKFQGKENELNKMLKEKYGRDLDHLLPLELEEMKGISVDNEEEKVINHLLGKIVLTKRNTSNLEKAQSTRKLVKEKLMRGFGKTKKNESEIPEDPYRKKSTVPTLSNKQKSSPSSDEKESPKSLEDRSDGKKDVYESSGTQEGKVQISSNAQLPPTKKSETSLVIWDYQSLYGGDLYTITWESDRLLEFSDQVGALISKFASMASQEVLKRTALATLISAVAWPSLVLKAADMIDSPYKMMKLKSDKAGIELANSLLQSEERRPVTLVGYSFGARIIFSCLLELARHQELWEEEQMKTISNTGTSPGRSLSQGDDSEKDDSLASHKDATVNEKVTYTREPASIVEDVILMGLPKYIYCDTWSACRRIVAGRLINCYSRKDWFLSLMFQYKSPAGVVRPTSGSHPVTCVEGIENYDVSGLVTSHDHYCFAVYDILRLLSFGKSNPIEVKSN